MSHDDDDDVRVVGLVGHHNHIQYEYEYNKYIYGIPLALYSLSFSAAGCLDFPIGIVLDEMETKKCGNGNEQGNRKRPAAERERKSSRRQHSIA